ncbi:hypothetical protein F5Y15DRAFT_409009 [Xylariaceae sp. FL0016]|nr:hypothetical protein F5Y15DRAFT_409009 [Xylariaceae sp. FL0016]
MADRSAWERDDEDQEGDEDELTEHALLTVFQDYRTDKDALIFAIEVSHSMLKPPPDSDDKKADKDPPVYAALKCAYQVMQQRIISNPKDQLAVLLYGTRETQTSKDDLYPHCYLLTDLDIPAAEDVKALKSLAEEGEDADSILVPSDEPIQMQCVLNLTKELFGTRAPRFRSKRIFIITDNDNPHAGDKHAGDASLNARAAAQAKDLYDCDVLIELFPVSHGTGSFDFSRFYDDIVYRTTVLEETSPGRASISKSGDGLSLLNSLISNVNSRQTPKRAYFSNMPFEIGPGFTISVKGYNIIQKQKPARTCYVWLDGDKAQIAVGETSRLAEDSARSVEKAEVKKAYKFGGEYVYFSEEEHKLIKQFGGPTIRVIGFKDRSLLKFWASVKKSIFIFPSEDGYVGSTRVFAALWRKLLDSKKIGIAWHIARANGNPQLVAIIPSGGTSQAEPGSLDLPAGLWLYPIPYVDDMREGPEKGPLIRTTDGLTDKMHKIIRQLQLPGGAYEPSKFPNPSLQWHYKILQALALEEEVPEQPEDKTVPKIRAIHKRCGGYIQDWSQEADVVLSKLQEEKAIKRDMEDEDDEARPAKKARTTAPKPGSGGDGMKDAELKKRYHDGTLAKLTVAEMRTAMAARGLDTKGLKKDLVERLEQWAEENTDTFAAHLRTLDVMDALLDSSSRSNQLCDSIQDLQSQLHNCLASNASETRAEHASLTFELRHNTSFHLTSENQNGEDNEVNLDQAQQAVTRIVTAYETVQNQPTNNPVLQKAVAKHLISAVGSIDSSSWTTRSVSRGAQGWSFSFICEKSLQAWNRAKSKSPKRPDIGGFSGNGGLDAVNLSRPAFDCRGTITVAFSKSSKGVVVKYEHTPLHKTVEDIIERLIPTLPPPPANTNGSHRTPKAKRPPPAEEEGSRKKRKKKGKASEASMNGGLADSQEEALTTPAQDQGLHLTSTFNVPPAEAERRRVTAIDLLSSRGIDPSTLSAEQFNIFANQAPDLQATSLEMLANYGAEKLRIVHPGNKDQAGASTSKPEGVNGTPAAGAVGASSPVDTPTKKKRSRKKKSDAAKVQVSIGDGATVPLEQNGELGMTESSLKLKSTKARKTRGTCETCRQRKLKCTKEHPSCLVCVRNEVDCVYMPPKPRRKSEKAAGEIDNSELPNEDEDEQLPAAEPELSDFAEHIQPRSHYLSDPVNEEFIPDPNILSGPVESHPLPYYIGPAQGTDNPTFSSESQPSGGTATTGLTLPVTQQQPTDKTSSNVPFASKTAQPSGADSSKRRQTSMSGRKSLPSGQPSSWNASPPPGNTTAVSPTMTQQQAAKRPRSKRSAVEPVQPPNEVAKQTPVPPPSQQSVVTRSPFQNTVRAKSRQGIRSQTSTPVSNASQPPPPAQPPDVAQPTTSAPYSSSTANSIPDYDPYARYDTTSSNQYNDTGHDQGPSRVTYESGTYQTIAPTTSASYSSSPSYDSSHSGRTANPLSQALNTSSGYSGGTNSTSTNQWLSQSRVAQGQKHTSTYSMPSTTASSHGYGTRSADRASTQNSYAQPQSQSYNYFSQQSSSAQQSQQNWYGFPPANSTSQATYTSDSRSSGYGTGQRSHISGYSGQYGSTDEQSLYDLLRASGANH